MTDHSTGGAAALHDRLVREEREQTERLASRLPSGDFWCGYAGRFRQAQNSDTADLDALAALVGRDDVVVDVGAGGGRLALPLAARCRMVYAVEPSGAMRSVLADEMARTAVGNVQVVAGDWAEAAEPAEADVAFCAHVTYGVTAIGPFLRKLDQVATRHAAAIVFKDPPQFIFAPFWQAVYGEARIRLPGATELEAVVREIGAAPDVIALPSLAQFSLGSRDEAIEELRRRLFAAPGSPADARLQQVLPELAEERDGQLWARHAGARERYLIRWRGGSLRAL